MSSMHCKLDQNKYVKLARMISETTWLCLLINIKRGHAGDYLTFYYFYRIFFKYQDMEIKEPWSIFLGCSQVTACPQGLRHLLLTLLPIIPLLHSTLKTTRIIPVVKARQNTLSQLHKLLLKHDTGKSSKCSKWALNLVPQPTCS